MRIKVKVLLKSAEKILVPTLFPSLFPQWGSFGNTGAFVFPDCFQFKERLELPDDTRKSTAQ